MSNWQEDCSSTVGFVRTWGDNPNPSGKKLGDNEQFSRVLRGRKQSCPGLTCVFALATDQAGSISKRSPGHFMAAHCNLCKEPHAHALSLDFCVLFEFPSFPPFSMQTNIFSAFCSTVGCGGVWGLGVRLRTCHGTQAPH